MKPFLFSLIVLFPIYLFAQATNTTDTTLIKVRIQIIEKGTRHTLEGAVVTNLSGDTIGISEKNGVVHSKVPDSTKYLIATLQGHSPERIRLYNKIIKVGSVALTPIGKPLYEDFWKEKRNNIEWAANELFNHGIGIEYTYHLKKHHAFGTHLTGYYQNAPASYTTDAYSGFKLSLHYRLFMLLNTQGAIYFQPKLIVGYFDSDKISYSWDQYAVYRAANFWTAGFGASFGFAGYKKNLTVSYNLSST